jgi:hypothetical protein
VRDFNTNAAPLNDLMKKDVSFHWGAAQDQAFHTLINMLTHAPLLQLLNFDKTFELECDASGIGIGGILFQEGKSMAYLLLIIQLMINNCMLWYVFQRLGNIIFGLKNLLYILIMNL